MTPDRRLRWPLLARVAALTVLAPFWAFGVVVWFDYVNDYRGADPWVVHAVIAVVPTAFIAVACAVRREAAAVYARYCLAMAALAVAGLYVAGFLYQTYVHMPS